MRSKGTAVDRYAARGMIRIPSAGTIVVRGTPSPEDHGATLPCDSYGQTVSALRAIVDAVARAGATMHDIVSTRISVSDPAAWT